MKLFFTNTHVVNMVNGNEIHLTNRETHDILSAMKELHRQRCERDTRA